MEYERYKAIQAQIELSKDPWRFAPQVRFKDEVGDWENIRKIGENTKAAVDGFIAEKARLEADGDYSPEGRAKRVQKYYEDRVLPAMEAARKASLPEFRKRAQADVAKASVGAFDLPTHPYQIALEMKALDAVREGTRLKGKTKLTLPQIEALPFETRRAIAVAPRHASGVSEHTHEVIRRKFLEEAGGAQLAEAQAYADAVEGVAEMVDHAEVVAEITAGIDRKHPMAEAGAKMKEALKERNALPKTEEVGDVLATTN